MPGAESDSATSKDQSRQVTLVYARSRNYCIGMAGKLPWQLPDEFDHFLATIRGFPLILGRRSFEDHEGLLPGSVNIVVSSQPASRFTSGVILAPSLQAALTIATQYDQRVFVLGGAHLFAEAFDHAVMIIETVVDVEVTGDTWLRPFDLSDWHTEHLLAHPADQAHSYAFDVFRHTRNRQLA